VTPAACAALAGRVAAFAEPEDAVAALQRRIHDSVLADARRVFEPNFTAIHVADLELLFQLYDGLFFDGGLRAALAGSRLTFRASTRMTSAGGKTTRRVYRNGEVSYEIAVAIGMLFDGFRGEDRATTVSGLVCSSRLEALQRIFEHEIAHLVEMLCWGKSNCGGARFQQIARRFFRHQAHTHNLVTRRERAAEAGIRVGSLVRFAFEGKRLRGRVNRITRRATVLVEDAAGQPFSDGKRYLAYYVPLGGLEPE
jgi:hypothetical protein